jgi:hypothetical protein
MKLVSTKRSPKQKKERDSICKVAPSSHEDYGYNTRLSLDKDTLDKLDITPKDFKVGQKVTVQAVAVVKTLRSVEGSEYDTSEIELQIQQIGVEKQAGSAFEAVTKAVKDAS